MTASERRELMERYASGLDAVTELLSRFDARQLDESPHGEWSARQIAHHLADTELFRSTRLRTLLAEDAPLLASFDESSFAERLFYERPIEASLALLRAATETNLALLACLDEADWQRAGTHEELGPFSVEAWLQRAANHAHEHAGQLRGLLPA
jgi:hypothetical protein